MSDQNWNPNQPQDPANDPYPATGGSQYGQDQNGQPTYDPNQAGYDATRQQPAYDPYAQVEPGASASDPYAQSAASASDPYAQAQSAGSANDPYAAYAQPSDPYAQPQQDPYATEASWTPPTQQFNPAAIQAEGTTFFQGLTDFTFTKYITPSVVRIVYILMVIVAALTWVFTVISGFVVNAGAGIAALLIGPIILVLYIALIRVGLETSIALIRVAEAAARIDEKIERPQQ